MNGDRSMIQSTNRMTRVLALLFFALCAFAPGQQAAPMVNTGPVMRTAAALLEHGHISEQHLDDTLSSKAFDTFIENLDPLKLYFNRSDIAEFEPHRKQLDNDLKNADLTFARKVFDRFLVRVAERITLVDEILKANLDFTADEQFITDGEYRDYPRDDDEARKIWTQRIKADLLSLYADEVDDKTARERLSKRYNRFQERIAQDNDEDLLTRFVNSIAAVFDPHSDFMAPKAFQDFEMSLNLNYQGIGAVLEDQDGTIAISRIMPGGAVEKYGKLNVKDQILAVGQGSEGEMVDVVGMRITDAVKLIRGPEDTLVRLSIRPAAGGPEVLHTLTRARIPFEDSVAKGTIVEHGDRGNGTPWKIGIIDLPSFYADHSANDPDTAKSSTNDMDRILRDFRKKEVDTVVLDLRHNGGGYLPEAIGVTGLFVDRGPVVQVKGGRRTRVLEDRERGRAWSGPLVVLVSQISASASEIVAGAIKDYSRGIIIGDRRTHGKGTVQSPFDIAEYADQKDRRLKPRSLGVLKLTIQQFFRPDGRSTQLEGVPSDIFIPSWTDVMDLGEDAAPYALPASQIDATTHQDDALVRDTDLEQMRNASSFRRSSSAYWLDLERQLSAYSQFRKRKSLPLNKEAYLKLQETLKSQQAATGPASTDDKKEKDPYKEEWFTEVLDITVDYSKLLAARKP